MKTKGFKQLTDTGRVKIEVLIKEGLNQTEIARKLKVHRSTVSRELNRHNTPHGYFAKMAQARHEHKRKKCRPKRKVEETKVGKYVLEKIYKGWSPETISGRLRREIKLGLRPVTDYVNHESIYRFVYESEFGKREKVYQYLRRGYKRRRRHYGRKSQKETIKNRIFIDDRPAEVNLRKTVGHWEGDAIIYPAKKAINSLVERKARFVILTKLERRTARLTKQAYVKQLSKHHCKTLTVDNGNEHTDHEQIAKRLGIKIFFCHPYHSWEKGTCENTNGLVRRYLPRRSRLEEVTQKDLNDIATELNDRPRSILDYQTPKEVLKSEYQRLT